MPEPMREYMTIPEFRMLFPEFKVSNSVDLDSVIGFYLDQAKPFVNRSVFQNFTKTAHGFKTAELIAASPYARTLRQDGSDSNYEKEFVKILNTCAPRMALLW
jgi:hypothetical protein